MTPRRLTDTERLDWIRLYRSENVGPVAFRRLLERFGSATAALEALPDLVRSGGGKRRPRLASPADAAREYDAIDRLGSHLLALPDPEYPDPLRHIADAPPILCVMGRLDLLKTPTVAIVGARNASTHGMRMAATLARDLATRHWTIVSGMARGIDTAAHHGAGAAHSIAVLAGGVDVTYPRENDRLHAALCESGCVISELPPGTQPQARHFPRRNRIVSGLAQGVVVVEATARSGSLITARFAAEQGREVFAVPGFPTDPRASGPNGLIKDGATLVESADDILAGLEALPNQPYLPGLADPPPPPLPTLLLPQTPANSQSAHQRLLDSLTSAPLPVDVALRQCQLSAAEGAIVLLELELAGRIERLPGQLIALAV